LKEDIRPILKAQILKKLRRHGYWGGRHTAFDELPKSLPSHLRGEASDVAEELIKEDLLIQKSTSYGRHVSLNPRKKADIDKIIKEVLKE
jgi:hypothetical protein